MASSSSSTSNKLLLGRQVGFEQGRPLYVAGCCSSMSSGLRAVGRLLGYDQGRPIYGVGCCATASSSSSSSFSIRRINTCDCDRTVYDRHGSLDPCKGDPDASPAVYFIDFEGTRRCLYYSEYCRSNTTTFDNSNLFPPNYYYFTVESVWKSDPFIRGTKFCRFVLQALAYAQSYTNPPTNVNYPTSFTLYLRTADTIQGLDPTYLPDGSRGPLSKCIHPTGPFLTWTAPLYSPSNVCDFSIGLYGTQGQGSIIIVPELCNRCPNCGTGVPFHWDVEFYNASSNGNCYPCDGLNGVRRMGFTGSDMSLPTTPLMPTVKQGCIWGQNTQIMTIYCGSTLTPCTGEMTSNTCLGTVYMTLFMGPESFGIKLTTTLVQSGGSLQTYTATYELAVAELACLESNIVSLSTDNGLSSLCQLPPYIVIHPV